MSALKLLQAASSIHDLAHLLGYKPAALGYLAYGLKGPMRYQEFQIPKRSGGARTISAPTAELKLLQRRLTAYLQRCLDELDKDAPKKRRVAHGFRPNHSIFSNAAVHRGRTYVLNIDLKDFFGTIHFGRVRGFFIANKNFNLHPDVATIVAQIVCHQNAIPQGAPTSPIVSNIIAHMLDMRLAKLAKSCCCSYTRYADDLTFSTSIPSFPIKLAVPEPANPNRWRAGNALEKEIARCGYVINAQKTRLQSFRSRQDVTGIVVNTRLSARSEYRATARAMVHRLRKKGVYELRRQHIANGSTAVATVPGSLKQLEGIIAFLRQVDSEHSKRSGHEYTNLSPAECLQQRFVFYRSFAAASQATVIFEGKTDAVYIREALRKLAPHFPLLASTTATGVKLLLSLYQPTKQHARLTGLNGGSSDFVNFIKHYLDDYNHITSPDRGRSPIIILLDNDSGAKPVLGYIKKRFGVTPAAGSHYSHVTENLYICLTAPPGGTYHCIEDLFDAAVLAHKLGTKSFSKENQFDSATEYGKAWFAERVVKPNTATINFDSFKPLLADIENILKAHLPSPNPALTPPVPAASPTS